MYIKGMENIVAAITKSVKRFGFDVAILDLRKPKYNGERGDLERDMIICANRFESTSDYDKRREFAKELAAATSRYLAVCL
jgi:hypothetical protein